MGFYIRKAFRAGPIRFNLSKSGFGASVGVTGARVGLSPQGHACVHGGRHVLYYRKSLGRVGGRARGTRAEAGIPGTVPGAVELTEDSGVTYGALKEQAQTSEAIAEPEAGAHLRIARPGRRGGRSAAAFALPRFPRGGRYRQIRRCFESCPAIQQWGQRLGQEHLRAPPQRIADPRRGAAWR